MGDFGGLFGFDPGGFFGSVGGVIDAIESEVLAALSYLYALLVELFEYLYGFLITIVQYLVSFAQTVWHFVNYVIGPYIREFIDKIVSILKTVKAFLYSILSPILRIINRIRTWYLIHILPWQKLIIEIVQRVRVALQILKLLGVNWAAKLDADLAKIQAWVTTSIQDVLRGLNTVSSTLGAILDPSMVLRKNFFAATLFSSLAGVKRAAGFGANNALNASQLDGQTKDATLLNPATPAASLNTDGSASFSDAYDSIRAALQSEGAAMAPPLP